MIATATEVKNRFGEFMDKAQREPVIVETERYKVRMYMSTKRSSFVMEEDRL